jgi:hypothetical protein
MGDADEDALITGYILRRTEPVQWVGWCLDAPEPEAEEALRAILFEPDGESLRDLTAPEVRDRVLRAVLAHAALRRAVLDEVNRLLDEVSNELSGDCSNF